MLEVVARKLWIGNARDGRDAKSLFANQIHAVVDLAAEEPPAHLPRELISCRLPLHDGTGNSVAILRIAVMTVATFVRNDIAVLVCCSGGMSRSPAIAACALSTWDGKNASEWLTEIRRIKPVDVSPSLWNELQCAME